MIFREMILLSMKDLKEEWKTYDLLDLKNAYSDYHNGIINCRGNNQFNTIDAYSNLRWLNKRIVYIETTETVLGVNHEQTK